MSVLERNTATDEFPNFFAFLASTVRQIQSPSLRDETVQEMMNKRQTDTAGRCV